MSEFTAQVPSPETVIPYVDNKSIRHWEKNLSPVLKCANDALQRQAKKQPSVVGVETPSTEVHLNKEGLVLMPEFQSCQLVRIGQPRSAGDWLLRGGSAHNVSFGVAELRENGEIKVLNIAVKQFAKPPNALQDATNNAVVLSRGFKSTHPVAVILDNAGGFILSVAQEDRKSLDTEPWHQYLNGSPIVQRHFRELLFRMAILLADYHTRGIRHSDAQVKNFWTTPRGNVEGIDWEASTVYPKTPSKRDYLTTATDDIPTLFHSLCGEYEDFPIPVLSGSKTTRWAHFYDVFLRHYIDRTFDNFTYSRPLVNYDDNHTLSDEELELMLTRDPNQPHHESVEELLLRTLDIP